MSCELLVIGGHLTNPGLLLSNSVILNQQIFTPLSSITQFIYQNI